MSAKRVTIHIPDNLFLELQRIAAAADWTVEQVILQTIRTGMPPSLQKVPPAFHGELLALNKLNDRDLLRVAEGRLAASDPQDDEHRKADFGALRRIYALSLLKWRGHPIPAPYESMMD